MKSLIYYGPGKLAMEERPIPETGSKDVLVKVARAGICGSDLTAYLYKDILTSRFWDRTFLHG